MIQGYTYPETGIPKSLLKDQTELPGVLKAAIDEAKEIVYGERDPSEKELGKSLTIIATYWENYLFSRGLLNENSGGLMPTDIAVMLALRKIAQHGNQYARRNIVNGIGYLALVDRIREELGER